MAQRIRVKEGVYRQVSEAKRYQGKADACFYITYRIGNKKKWEKIGWLSQGYSPELAAGIRRDRLQKLTHGDDLPQKKKPAFFSDAGKTYLAWAEKNRARKGRDEKGRYAKHIQPVFGDRLMSQISRRDLETFKQKLSDEGLAGQTVKHCLCIMREIYNHAIADGFYRGSNPVMEIKMPKLNNARERFLTHDEARLLLDELKNVSVTVHDMALLSLFTGMRAGEVFNLRGRDLDFKNGIITILDAKAGNRKATMTPTVREMLNKRIPLDKNAFVFTDRWHGGKVDLISRTFARVVETLKFNEGVEDRRQRVTFHTLRHTFASWAVLQGENLFTIRDLLGHKTLAMVSRYGHLAPGERKRATLSVEAAFEANSQEATHAER